jgi:tRNA G26 N,N-dimethylase Trm1
MPKYDGAKAMKCEFVHEVAIRLLLGFIARKSKRIIKPVLSLSTDHYIRVFVKFGKIGKNKIGYVNYNPKTGKRSVSKIKKKNFKHAGPLWIGKLWDKPFLKKLDFQHKLLDFMIEEANGKPLFYTTRELVKGIQPPIKELLKKFKATRTHFKPQAIRKK